jgi:hypothetical protein
MVVEKIVALGNAERDDLIEYRRKEKSERVKEY